MKTKITLGILTLMTAVSFAGNPPNPSLVFEPNSGTYNTTDTFSFDALLTFDGFNATGISFWLETVNAFAGSLSITGLTFGTTFPSHSDPALPVFFNSGLGADPGYLVAPLDLGSSSDDFGNLPGPGTYLVAHITLSISGAVPGTYDISTTTISPRGSEVTSFDQTTGFADRNLPATHYTVTIVPEPNTLALIGSVAILSLVFISRRRSRFVAFLRRGV
jgi:hypothetical protein